MNIVDTYNNLEGKRLSRIELNQLVSIAKSEQNLFIADKLKRLLDQNPGEQTFNFNKVVPLEMVSKSFLSGLECFEDDLDSSDGLDGGVSSDEIYSMITDKFLKIIESKKELPWRKPWKSISNYGLPATNFDSKKPYRGINSLLLNEASDFENPYFLTFKQVDKHGGKVIKGEKGSEVIYFVQLYKYKQDNQDGKLDFGTYNASKFMTFIRANKNTITFFKGKSLTKTSLNSFLAIHTIPILKYYNVWNGEQIEGIDWKLKPITPKKKFEIIESAEAIVSHMPKAPEIINKGAKAFYSPSNDKVTMPSKDKFKEEQKYYSVLFHELTHSTGSKTRLKRDFSGAFGTPKYAFEELIAELGASFLNAESGILYFNQNNSAAYLKSWISNLTKHMRKDNKFFFRASSKAQAAADLILDRNAEGVPAYLKKSKAVPKQQTRKRIQKPSAKKSKPGKIKVDKKTGQTALFGVPEALDFVKDDPLFTVASDRQKEQDQESRFRLKGVFGDFLKDVGSYKCLIELKGDTHAGKSEFVMQLTNAFIESDYTVVYFDLEQGGLQSADTIDAIDRNLPIENQNKIAVTGRAPKGIDTIKEYAEKAEVVVIDSFQKLGIPNTRMDELREEFPNTKFIVIFQQNAEGGTRGGVSSDFDAPVIIKVHKVAGVPFVNNYAEILKNRGNADTIYTRYSMAQKDIIK